ncbi:MAG: response regulator [Roseibacillus sp.]
MKRHIRVFLADDHPPLRAGLAAILNSQSDFKVVGEAGSGRETLESEIEADVYVVDVRMPEGGGIHVIKSLRERDPNSKVLILTTFDNEEDIFRALEAGARGYLLKDTTTEELVQAVRQVHEGERYLPPAIASRLADRLVRPSLSPRELDVLRLVAKGRSNKELASAMFISEETVKSHMKSLFLKLDVHDRAEAVSASLKRGIIRI